MRTEILDPIAKTDPDLAAIASRHLADVARDVTLPTETDSVVVLGALVAVGAGRALRAVAAAALDDGVSPAAILEVLYQAVPYVGLGRALDSLEITHEVLAEHGVQLPLPSLSTTSPNDRAERGLAVQKQIVGDRAVETMYADAPADEMHIQRYLSAHCFGDHYTRDGLDLRTRELLTLAMLVALGGADPQVKGHVKANLRVGNDRATLIAVVTRLLPYVGYPRTLNALRAIDEVAPPAPPEETS